MTIDQVLSSIYKRFEKSVDTPDKTSEDYFVRLEYANASIQKWENEQGIEWKELFGTITGTLTSGVCSDNSTTLANFKRPAGFLRIGDDKYEYVRPEQVEKDQREHPSKKIYTVTGSKGSFSIVVYPTVDGAFTLNYRKHATTYSTGSETIEVEMSDPTFVIHDVLAQLYLDDSNGQQANVELQVSGAKMDAMRLANEIVPFYQDSTINDEGIAFGR